MNVLPRITLRVEGSLQKYIESATYVNLKDCMLFQKKGRDKSVDVVVRRSVGFGQYQEEMTTCRCSWLPTINAIQIEDSNGHGYPFTPVEKRGTSNDAVGLNRSNDGIHKYLY